ncbi:2-dehydro-3-deoxygalactonokinase [Deinococcus marmoris]|uniref:2-dehydro-3-deoxygalactonokinase n=1 Tax=Deinococcus marmoris TaxID=249408 RepID=A0A1U7P111_9DEIO|nr:2-dehydro-3-deoxygalactonokinase [Deinococcus marmoris]OLV18856.1 2-dehydro-3-deoxygalactonokinase [Deinococcus marmoris]
MIAFLDGGTTQTRLRVWDGQSVQFDTAVLVGARTGAVDGHSHALRAAVQELIGAARQVFPLDAVVACGMLTSPTGLYEVPHLVAPISTARLASHLVSREIEGCGPILFIPGIRTQDIDVMRGEETEVTGLRQILGLRGPVNFLHFGSHDKLIYTDDDGIQGSLTNLNGELLNAMTGATILKSNTQNPVELSDVDQHWWRQGMEAARQHGLSRAAFLVRIGGLLRGVTPGQGTSWLLGALAEGNLRWIEQAGPERTTVLYGRSTVTQPFMAYLTEQGFPAQIASEAHSALAAVIGAARLYELWRGLAGQTQPSRPAQP